MRYIFLLLVIHIPFTYAMEEHKQAALIKVVQDDIYKTPRMADLIVVGATEQRKWFDFKDCCDGELIANIRYWPQREIKIANEQFEIEFESIKISHVLTVCEPEL